MRVPKPDLKNLPVCTFDFNAKLATTDKASRRLMAAAIREKPREFAIVSRMSFDIGDCRAERGY
jgi:hypothetical protein